MGQDKGEKYLRRIKERGTGKEILIDVYDVIEAYGVACPAIQHALKKLLCPGHRGAKDYLQDLLDSQTCLGRAIELQVGRQDNEVPADMELPEPKKARNAKAKKKK